MATIINNPTPTLSRVEDQQDRGMGFVVGLILAVVVLVLLFAYGIPALRGTRATTNSTPSAQINVPDKVDVNVNK